MVVPFIALPWPSLLLRVIVLMNPIRIAPVAVASRRAAVSSLIALPASAIRFGKSSPGRLDATVSSLIEIAFSFVFVIVTDDPHEFGSCRVDLFGHSYFFSVDQRRRRLHARRHVH